MDGPAGVPAALGSGHAGGMGEWGRLMNTLFIGTALNGALNHEKRIVFKQIRGNECVSVWWEHTPNMWCCFASFLPFSPKIETIYQDLLIHLLMSSGSTERMGDLLGRCVVTQPSSFSEVLSFYTLILKRLAESLLRDK
uniref:Uncharacterized protein n=1 Tax=Myotis myotis TaxID=51298 RepID=A0A7J7ZXL3_MYOMY|nr:hypothetical protein mMyoMyo1_009712 [Myotis myotis]